MVREPRRGEIYWADLDPVVGSEQAGRRPALVVQNDRGNMNAATTIVVPLSTRFTSKPYPFQVWLQPPSVPKRSLLKCEQVRTVDKSRLHPGCVGRLDPETMSKVDDALMVALGLDRGE